jgi:hypothetical protein
LQVESGVSTVHGSRSSGTFQNVLEAFDAAQRRGRTGRRLTSCFSYRQPEHSGRISETTDRDDGDRGKSGGLGAKPGREAGARPNKLGRTGSGLNHDSGGDGHGGTSSRSSGDRRKESAGRGGRKRRGGGPNQDESPDKRGGSRGRDPEENRGKERRHQATPARTRLEDRGGKKENLHSAEENHRGHQQGNDGEADLSTGRPASGPRSAGRNPGGGKRHAYGGRPGKSVLQVRLQRMEATAGRDTRGPSQKKLDQLREDLAKEAGVEPPARKGAQPPTEQSKTVGKKKGAKKTQGGQTKGARQQGGPTEGAQPQGGRQGAPSKGAQPQGGSTNGAQSQGGQKARVEEVHETVVAADSGCGLKNILLTGGHQSDRGPGGPDEHPEGRVCGPCLQEQGTEGEGGAGTAQEGGSDDEGHPKDEPHTDPDRAGGALERRRCGGGRPAKERLAARRAAAGRVPEELRVPHQEEVPEREAAEHGLRRGTENP